MRGMFRGARSFNQDISGWDTSGVTDMSGMFNDARAFDQDLSRWNTAKITSMRSMFKGAGAFDRDLSDWDISNVDQMTDMFLDATLSTENYDALLIGWANQENKGWINFHGGNSRYSAGEAAEARARLIDEYYWRIQDGGQVSN